MFATTNQDTAVQLLQAVGLTETHLSTRLRSLADTSKSLATELGILEAEEKIAYRATFIVDPQGTIRWVSLYDLNVGRNVKEVLRVLDALQTDELCPCNWVKGEATLAN